MTDVTVNAGTDFGLAGAERAALKARGYLATVVRRLRYDYVTLFFMAVIAADRARPRSSRRCWRRSIPTRPAWSIASSRSASSNSSLGTDELGRDMASRLIYGGRVSLVMGITPVCIASDHLGGLLGVLAGFFGGRLNMMIMRTVDMFYAFPSVLLAVAISGVMGGGMANGLVALTLVFIPPLCRISETATTQVRNLDFVEAARASGASDLSIIVHHILRNVAGAGVHLRVEPDLGVDPAGGRPVVPRARGRAADARLGPDALQLAPGDLRAAAGLRAAWACDLHHLALVQSGQRRPAPGHGREGLGRHGASAGSVERAPRSSKPLLRAIRATAAARRSRC